MIDLFLDNLPLILDADGDGKRIRDVILQLAVRGRLVRQEGSEAWTSEALDGTQNHLEGLARATSKVRWKRGGRIGMSVLTSGWASGSVNDTGLYVNGLAFNQAKWADGGLPIIRIQNLSGSSRQFNYAKGEYPREVMVDPGDLLVSWSATLDAYLWNGPRGVLNQHIFRVEENRSLVCRGFLYLLLKRVIREMAASDHAHGLAMKHINRGPFLAHAVEIPPLAEQHRIVAKVDELMGHAAVLEERHLAASSARVRLRDAALHALAEAEDHEAVETAWSRIEEHFEDLFTEPEDIQPLRQTILQLAVRGRLVGRDEKDGSTVALLQQLGTSREAAIASGRRSRRQLDESALSPQPDWLPSEWRWVELRDAAEVVRGVTYSKNDLRDEGTGVPLLRAHNIQSDIEFVDLAWIDQACIHPNQMLRAGDILICIASGSANLVGKSAMLCREGWHGTFGAFNAAVRPRHPLPPKMLAMYLRSPDGWHAMRSLSRGIGINNLKTTSIAALGVPLPPLAEQHRIVAKVDELMALCDTLEASLTRATAAREQFAASISDAISEASLPIPTIGSRG